MAFVANPCPATSVGGYNWLQTVGGSTASLSCLSGYSGSITLHCNLGGSWASTPSDSCTCAYLYIYHIFNFTIILLFYFFIFFLFFLFLHTFLKYLFDVCVTFVAYPCAASTVGGYNWPQTAGGSIASLSCPSGYSGNITLQCYLGGSWASTLSDSCTCAYLYIYFYFYYYYFFF